MLDFTDQVVVVTGAGRGLGRLYALELARRGASVVVNDVGGTMEGNGADPIVADEVVAEIEAAGGVAVASHESVSTPESGRGSTGPVAPKTVPHRILSKLNSLTFTKFPPSTPAGAGASAAGPTAQAYPKRSTVWAETPSGSSWRATR